MPPYWENKALPTPTPNPNRLTPMRHFIFHFSIISFIFTENKCLSGVICDDLIRTISAKDGFKLGSIASKTLCYAIYYLHLWSC